MRTVRLLLALCALALAPVVLAAPPQGYYRMPAIHGDTIVFAAEGDLWKVDVKGGTARRLTSHVGEEGTPAISPDGRTLAFTAQYEGPTEVYTMPIEGGLPVRRTFEAGRVAVAGFANDGKLLYATNATATLPSSRLIAIDLATGARTPVPLAQASDGTYDEAGTTLYFTRLPFQGSNTKRYRGGTVQQLWKFTAGTPEAVALTSDFTGTSKRPLWWQGRVYFVSDRDGTMNLWSMDPDGKDLRQLTHHAGWDVASPSLDAGRIVYQLGADLRLYDIATNADSVIPIALDSDFDQERERWLKKPLDYMTSAHVAPTGDRIVLTARGRVFVAPAKQGRFVAATHDAGVRWRDARFMPDGKSLVALSDKSGEVEVWQVPANGVGEPVQLTTDGDVLRWEAVPSPDGKFVAHHDKNQRLWLLDVAKKTSVKIDESEIDNFSGLAWSPDSRWLAYVVTGDNLNNRIRLYRVADGAKAWATTERYESYSPTWSPDGKWLYFLSDRHLESVVPSPWGALQPEPFFDKRTKIYQLALTAGQRSPFAPADELHPAKPESETPPADTETAAPKSAAATPAATTPAEPAKKPDSAASKKVPEVKIDLAGLAGRIYEVPIAPGNYSDLMVTDKFLMFVSSDSGREGKRNLQGAPIAREDVDVKTVVPDVKTVEMSADRKSVFVRQGDTMLVVEPGAKPADLSKKSVDLSEWTLPVTPREEWRQMFHEAWRLERDYFYDTKMHGVNWPAMLTKYAPLVDRVRSRGELSDVVAQMVAELSALHIFVRGGDSRRGDDNVQPSFLGAELAPDTAKGGLVVTHIYASDPDRPELTSPLARPGVDVHEGDVIEQIDGVPAATLVQPGQALRGKANHQVLLRVKPAKGSAHDVIVQPLSPSEAEDLRYHEWEYTRRTDVDAKTNGQVGYVHLRAMGSEDIAAWAREFYPVFTRPGLIIDVRNNRGGNIDSWIVSRLLRKAWSYWSQRVGQQPLSNMQYAFNGHVAVLCNESTASDGEEFTEAIKRLKIGKVFGTRTWGGEIWLSSSNFLVDRGIATAAEMGVYGPEGEWLIEGHGVDPDVVVDNPPHATFEGHDAQLDAAVAYLQQRIKEAPVAFPKPPKHPDKSR